MIKFNKPAVLSKFNLDAVPFEQFADTDEVGRETLAKQLSLTSHTSWFMPQLLAKFGSFTAVKNASGQNSPLETLKANIGDDPKLKGMYFIACKLNRSALITGQTSPANAPYCSLVPLILAAFKKYQNIPYSSWDREELKYIVDKNLYSAMTHFTKENMPIFSKDRLLELRDHGLTYRSGPKAGTARTVLGSWTLVGMKGTEFDGYPSLLMTMLTQLWCAHPSIRHEYMVLDPVNWDNTPEPLIDTTMGLSAPLVPKPKQATDCFWDA